MLDKPRLLRASPLLRHLPTLLWLVEAFRPSRFVQVGLDDPILFFAVCQAMEQRVLAAEGLGFGPLPADEAESLRIHARTFHARTVRITEELPTQGARDLADSSVDLLFLDLGLEKRTNLLRFDWGRLLSSRGVVLIHGLGGGPEVQEAVDRLTDGCHAVRPEHMGGLLMLAKQLEDAETLSLLFGKELAQPSGPGIVVRLSELICAEAEVMELRSSLDSARKSVDEVEAAKAEATNKVETLQAKLDGLMKSYDARTAIVAEAQARLFDAERREAERLAEIESLKQEVVEAGRPNAEALASRDSALALMRKRLSATEAERDNLKWHAIRRDAELEQLTRRLALSEPTERLLTGQGKELTRTKRRLITILAKLSRRARAPVRSFISLARRQ